MRDVDLLYDLMEDLDFSAACYRPDQVAAAARCRIKVRPCLSLVCL